jgi:hypothetical protein
VVAAAQPSNPAGTGPVAGRTRRLLAAREPAG